MRGSLRARAEVGNIAACRSFHGHGRRAERRPAPRARSRARHRARRQPPRLVGSAAQGCAQMHPLRPLQACDPDGVRRRAARRLDHVRRRAARRPGGSRRAAVRRTGRATCSTPRWRRPGSTARPSTSPTRSSISSSSQRGKRRIHNKPDAGEIEACRWWIEHERELIRPPVTVALGATAARSACSARRWRSARFAASRCTLADGSECWITVHPSFLLRIPEEDRRREERALFVRDLKRIKARAAELARLEAIAERRLHRPRRAGRDIVVGVRGREIMRAEQILDVDLRLDAVAAACNRAPHRRARSRAASPHC